MDVVGIDVPVVDFLINLDKLPETNKGAKMHEYSWQGGGKVSTALAALGRLGADTGMLATVGDDFLGRFIINDFKTNHVDTSRIKIHKGTTTPFCVPISERVNKSRSILWKEATCPEVGIADLDREYITSAKYLHLTYFNETTLQAANWAKEAGMKVVFDADYSDEGIKDPIELTDVFIGSEDYYNFLFKDGSLEANCRSLQKIGPEIVIFTRGDKGCFGVGKEGYFTIPAFKVETVDTTGAGDVFHGAFIFGLLKGWETRDTARFASAVSAIKCTRLGGRAGIPDYGTVMKFLEKGSVSEADIEKIAEKYKTNLFS